MSLTIKGKTAVVMLTAEELAKLLNVDENVLPSLRLARYSFAGYVRYSYTDIVAFLKACRIEPKSTKRVEFSKRHRYLELVPDAAAAKETEDTSSPDAPAAGPADPVRGVTTPSRA